MSKFFLQGGIVLSALLLATSCSNDDVLGQSSGEMATVSFSVNTESVAGSRAISDGSGANKLYYRAFRLEGDNHDRASSISELKEIDNFQSGQTVTLQLPKNQDVVVAFFAQNSDAACYTVTNDNAGMDVEIDYNGGNNDESRDAFFGTESFVTVGNETKTVTLTRPFAQVNVGTNDYAAFEAAGYNLKSSSVTIKNAANKLNLIDGSVSGDVEVNFSAVQGDLFKQNEGQFYPSEQLSVNGNEYTWLSMCYVLPNATPDAQASTTVSAEFNFQSDKNTITLKDGLENMPIQRNYRTNVIGQILTGNVNFNVEIDKNFQTPSHNIQTATELENAAINGGEVTLSGDVTLGKGLSVKKDLVINLNGHNILSQDGSYQIANTIAALISAQNGATVTINGEGEVNGLNGKTYAVEARGENSKVIINGGTYVGNTTAAYALNGGSVTINGGSFCQKGWTDDNYVINLKDNSGSSMTVTGGKFKNFDPSNNSAEGTGTNFVNTGYKSVENNGWYYVITNNGKLISSAQELVEFGNDVNQNQNSYHGQTIVLTNDIDMTGQNWTPAAQAPYQFAGVFDGYGHTIKNLNINSEINPANYAVGFFGWISGNGCVKNVNFDNATVKGLHWVGVVVGYLESGIIENVTVNGSTVSAVYDSSKRDDGDKAGGICGFINRGTIKDCKVTNSAIDAVRDAGQLAGCANNNIAFIVNPTASNVTVTSNNSSNGAVSASNIGGLVGSWRN